MSEKTEILYPAEFVFPGHPDKLCDAIADALVAAAIAREPRALVGVEVAVHRDRVFVTGRIGGHDAGSIDVPEIVREVYRSAGYGDGWYPAAEELRIETDLCVGPLEDGEPDCRVLSDDQAICVGYAVDRPETQYLPVEQWLVGQLARRLHCLRTERPDLELGPDGKVLAVVGESAGSFALRGFSCSLQQRAAAEAIALHRAVRVTIEEELQRLSLSLPALSGQVPEPLAVNGAGAFEVGGPEGDNGLSGKKLVMDAYGPRVAIGGGAWSGKDFHKADRAGALLARRLAKLVVLAGMSREATVTVNFAPGDRAAQLVNVVAEGAGMHAAQRCLRFLEADLSASGGRWCPDGALVEVAWWGHFQDARLPWESFGRL
ncbi:MAG TPA: methionine adenosyltransferase domain-containing protein [Candidatus Acidoferrales bacterium]|nr:methionine adenosyltransferase domain-containing protein [Candidatus Acidoferrales bacterium]